MTKKELIFVILLVILVTYGFFVIFTIHDKTSTVMVGIHDKDDNPRVTKNVTMTEKDDKLSSMTEISDKDGFVTFRYISRGEYIIEIEPDCMFQIELNKRFYTIEVIQADNLECTIKRPE